VSRNVQLETEQRGSGICSTHAASLRKGLEHKWVCKDHLVAIGQGPTESKRLLRKIYAALAEAGGLLIGAEKMDETAMIAAASSISERTKEIKDLIK